MPRQVTRATINRPGFRQLEVDYGRVTVFHGPNGAGKTTMLNAPVIALGGGEPSISVSATWDNGTTVHRSTVFGAPQPLLVVHPRGAVSKVRAAEEFIATDLGRAWSWDAAEFLALSDRKRTEELRRYIHLDIPMERARAAVLEAVPDLFELIPQITGSITAGQVWVAAVVESLQEAWRVCNATKKSANAAPTAATLQDLPGGTVASWRERRDEIDLDLGAARTKLGRLEGGADGRRMLETDLTQTRRNLDSAERDLMGHTQRCNAQRRQIEEANRDGAGEEANRKKMEAGLPQMRERKAEMDRLIQRTEAQLRDAEAAAAVSAAATELGIVALLERVTSLTGTHYADDARRILAVLADVGTVDSNALRAEVAGSKGQSEALFRRITGHESMIRQWQDPYADAKRAEAQLVTMIELEDRARANVAALKARVTQLTDQLATVSQGTEVTAIGTSIRGLEQERAIAERNIDRLNDAVQAQLMREQLSTAAERAESMRARVRDAGTKIRAVETALLDEATSPLLAPATTLTQAVLGLNLGLKLIDGGSHVTLGHRPLAEHSESERVVAMMALQVAVQTQIGGWRVAVVDGLEVLDEDRRFPFFQAVTDLVDQGRLDQFLGAHVGRRDFRFHEMFPGAYRTANMELEP
jgi:hypothetical protein